jgi:hypothetical protein
VLGLSIGALLSVCDNAEHEAAALSHRSALKAHVFFLAWLTRIAEDEVKAAPTNDPAPGISSQPSPEHTTYCRTKLVFSWVTCPLGSLAVELMNLSISPACLRNEAGVAGRGKSRRNPAGSTNVLVQWDWDGQRDRLARALGGVADIDLGMLFSPASPDEAFLQTWCHTVSHTL